MTVLLLAGRTAVLLVSLMACVMVERKESSSERKKVEMLDIFWVVALDFFWVVVKAEMKVFETAMQMVSLWVEKKAG